MKDKIEKAPSEEQPSATPVELPLFPSMKNCAAKTGIPYHTLRKCKAKGLDGFQHNKVDLGRFIRSFFAHDWADDKNKDWTAENKRLDAILRRIEIDRKKGEVIESAYVIRFNSFLRDQFFIELDRFAQELPPKVNGQTEIPISDEIHKLIEQTKQNIRAAIDRYEKDEVEKEAKLKNESPENE